MNCERRHSRAHPVPLIESTLATVDLLGTSITSVPLSAGQQFVESDDLRVNDVTTKHFEAAKFAVDDAAMLSGQLVERTDEEDPAKTGD